MAPEEFRAQPWVVEYSPYSARTGKYPWHITTLKSSLRHNRQQISPEWENVWMTVFVGTAEGCYKELEVLQERFNGK